MTVNLAGELRVMVPIRLVNPLNNRKGWRSVWRRGKDEKFVVGVALRRMPLPTLPVAVTITRIGKGTLDTDNLGASCKHVRDAIAAAYKLDDANPLLTWHYAQMRGDYACEICIRTLSTS